MELNVKITATVNGWTNYYLSYKTRRNSISSNLNSEFKLLSGYVDWWIRYYILLFSRYRLFPENRWGFNNPQKG